MNGSSWRTLVISTALLVAGAGAPQARAQTWSSIGGGANDWVFASAVFEGDLVVGGKFTFAGGTPANRIARWDGQQWTSLGSGFDGEVRALAVYQGKLVAGGFFVFAGGLEVKFIAQWDGTTWSDLEGGMDGPVSALAVHGGSLYAGGYFTDADGPASHVARWDGHSWFPVGSGTGGTQGQVLALAVYGGELVAGGFFTSAGGVAANHVARWNGTTWAPLGAGIGHIVYALTKHGDSLAAGGLFSSAGGVPAQDVALWDGASWTALGSGIGGGPYGYVLALASYGGDLFAGGIFTTAGGASANCVARWNGTAWSPLQTGMFNGGSTTAVYSLTVHEQSLIAGGIFSSAGSVSSGNVARWNQAFFDHGTGCAGSSWLVPVLAGVGVPRANAAAGVAVTHGLPHGLGLLFLGTQAAATPLLDCTFLLGGTLVGPIALPLDAAGAVTAATTLPAATPVGVGIRMQVVGVDAGAPNGACSMTNELLMVVQP